MLYEIFVEFNKVFIRNILQKFKNNYHMTVILIKIALEERKATTVSNKYTFSLSQQNEINASKGRHLLYYPV